MVKIKRETLSNFIKLSLMLCVFSLTAQVGVGTTTPNTSAQLDVVSTTKGFLLPRMTTDQRDAITSPATGLQIYNTDKDCVQIYNGSLWDCTANVGASAPEKFLIWAYGDVQVDTDFTDGDGVPGEDTMFRTIINDANTLDMDMALVTGDIVDRGSDNYPTSASYDFVDYINDLKKLNLPRHKIFHIAGNHDTSYNSPSNTSGGGGLTEYDKYFPKRNFYTLQGNILIIYMSTERRNTGGFIPDSVFEWWKKIVIENQDKILISVTHHPIYNTINNSTGTHHFIENSNRFIDVLNNYNHDLWIAGHVAQNLNNSNTASIKHGTLHINVGLHIPSATEGSTFDPKSRILLFENDSDVVKIKLRNHVSGTWIAAREINYTLNTKAELSKEPIYDGRYQFDADHDLMREGLHLFSVMKNDDGDDTADDIQRPLTITLNDARNLNYVNGAGTGILFQLAGSPNDSEPFGTHNYGVGASIDAIRETGTDKDYDTGLSFKTSGSDDDLSALTESLRLTSTGNVGIGTSTPSAKLHILENNDVTPSSVNHALTLGNISAENIAFDNNEILARNNGSAGTLILQKEDGFSAMVGDGFSNYAKLAVDVDAGDGKMPALLLSNTSYGDLVSPNGESLEIGHWNEGTETFTERLHIAANGNVGIGIGTPSAKLHIFETNDVTPSSINHALTLGNITAENIAIDNNEILARNNGSAGTLILQKDDGFSAMVGDGFSNYAKLAVDVDAGDGKMPALLLSNTSYGDLVSPNGESLEIGHWNESTETFTERLHIAANGNVGIGVAAPSVALDVNGSIQYTGTITDVSDKNLKENIAKVENVLPKITQITAYSYNMKDDKNKIREYGVFAQDVKNVFPEMVKTINKKGDLGMSYIQLIPVLLEGMKEQQSQINELQKQIELLLKRLEKIENK